MICSNIYLGGVLGVLLVDIVTSKRSLSQQANQSQLVMRSTRSTTWYYITQFTANILQAML